LGCRKAMASVVAYNRLCHQWFFLTQQVLIWLWRGTIWLMMTRRRISSSTSSTCIISLIHLTNFLRLLMSFRTRSSSSGNYITCHGEASAPRQLFQTVGEEKRGALKLVMMIIDWWWFQIFRAFSNLWRIILLEELADSSESATLYRGGVLREIIFFI